MSALVMRELVYSPFDHLMPLLAQEYFVDGNVVLQWKIEVLTKMTTI